MRLVALIGDPHTTINPLFDPRLGVRYYPLELYSFSDGLFIRAADAPYGGLVGARVERIGRLGADKAIAAVATLIPHDNDWWVRAFAPVQLMIPEILEGLGVVEDSDRLPLVLERDGRWDTVIVAPAGPLVPSGHNPRALLHHSDWAGMRAPGEPPLWLRHPESPYWMEYLPAERTLYVCYRGVVSLPHGESNPEFWQRVFGFVDEHDVDRLVLDLRENIGGNGFYNRAVILGIIRRPRIDQPGKLFVIIGRQTFSAAMDLALRLDDWTNATFVGEPTGSGAQFFGDHEPLVLPNSGISVNISTRWWQPGGPMDDRPFIAPSIYAPITSGGFRANRDPALAAILSYRSGAGLTQRMEMALAAGDTVGAERLLSQARADTANTFRDLEAEVNALGYRLLNDGRLAVAIQAFSINARAYPQSANVFDSLGEALAAAGRRDEAIAAYRQALRIDPMFAPSLEGLRRLGARP